MKWHQIAGSAVAVILCAVFPLLAFAHATPLSYDPAAGATKLETPLSVSVRFTERIEMGASSLTVFAPDGTEVQLHKGELDPADGRELAVPIEDKGEGVYSVTWQVVSVDDGHFTKGSFSFLVDRNGAVFEGNAGGVEVTYSSQLPEAILGFAVLIGESLVLSVLLLLALLQFFFRTQTKEAVGYITAQRTVLTHVIIIATILFISGSTFSFVRKSIELAALQETSLLSALLTYLSSTVGTFIALKIGAILAVLCIFLFWRKRLFSVPSLSVVAILLTVLVGILYMQSQVSHAAASFLFPKLSIAATFVHLAAKEFIIGGVLLLCLLLGHAALRKSWGWFLRLVALYDTAAAWALLFAGVSGAYISWLHLKHFENLSATAWGERFLLLLCAAFVLGIFRVWHQFFIGVGLDTSVKKRKIYMFTLPAEAVVGLVVLFCSGYIAITTPPFTVLQYAYSRDVVAENVQVILEAHPYEEDMMLIRLRDALVGSPINAKEVVVTAHNAEKNIGPNIIAVQQRSAGGYAFPYAALSPHGKWEITVIVIRQQEYDAYAQFTVEYPDDILATAYSDDKRSFDEVALVFVCAGIGIALLSAACMAHAHARLRKKTAAADKEVVRIPLYKALLFAGIIAIVACIAVFGLYSVASYSTFKQSCIAHGHAWMQTFPARDFSPTSPNALNGCYVHDGHFHFADEEEYLFFETSMKK